ncbi:MAG: dihydrofolate reductase family protein [Chloroflexi bacterium]|nr:dihydrofolate reductase family protein [Chloroflexota bacterium]
MDPLQTLFDAGLGEGVPLPEALASIYGDMRMPARNLTQPSPAAAGEGKRPWVIGNFVSSLDGVVALNIPGKLTGGGEIAGNAPHDRFVMGLLRALADVIVVGAGTLRSAPNHVWTADHVSKGFEEAHRELRQRLGRQPNPLTVVVSNTGQMDLDKQPFRDPLAPILIVATDKAADVLRDKAVSEWVSVREVSAGNLINARTILDEIASIQPAELILTEGGPRLMADFMNERCLDELFLTLSPQVVGREPSIHRPGFADGRAFAPDNPIWGNLVSLKKGGDHLFLRYRFPAE